MEKYEIGTCKVCGVEFARARMSQLYCGQKCRQRARSLREGRQTLEEQRAAREGAEHALCSRCKRYLPFSEFHRNASRASGRQSWCKMCTREHARSWAKKRTRVLRGLPPDFEGKIPPGSALPIGTRRVTGHGYVVVKTADVEHPRADKWGWVAEHLLVAEEKYGFQITRDFTVHHINGDRADNRPENLELRFGPHGKGADYVEGILRSPEARERARIVLAAYEERGAA